MNTFDVYVRSVNGQVQIPVAISCDMTISAFRALATSKIFGNMKERDYEHPSLKFIFSGTQLMEKNESNQDLTIGHYNIQKECVIHYLLIINQRLDVKLYLDGQARRFELDNNDEAFTQLLRRLDEIYPSFLEKVKKNKYFVTYLDNEGDAVTISTDRDFIYYLKLRQSWNNDKLIRLWVTKKQFIPPPGSTDVKEAAKEVNDTKNELVAGQIIQLKSVSSGQYLRINADGSVDGLGQADDRTKFKISHEKKHPKGFQILKLQSVADPKKWIRVENEKALNGLGSGGILTEFILIRNPKVPDRVSFRSVKFPKCHVGILPDGTPKAPNETGTGDHGSFMLTVSK